MNEHDLESPGYEFLRSYENMTNLHTKLLVLNYEKQFCLAYKCPPIHRFYFSLPSNQSSEQRFLFTCLCAWLIRDKCHMNLEIEPDEYEDLDETFAVVLEALRLITSDNDDGAPLAERHSAATIDLPNQNRLKRGYGPEVIWTLNILADRALELMLNHDHNDDSETASDKPKMRLAYKQSPTGERNGSLSNSITVGQPFVGGGLTTRPLGNYIIDDRSLLLDDDDDDNLRARENPSSQITGDQSNALPNDVDSQEWYKKVESSMHMLESVRFDEDLESSRFSVELAQDWTDEIRQIDEVERCIELFLDKSRSGLENTASLIDRQLQLIQVREKYLQTRLRDKLDDFLNHWRKYSVELERNKELLAQVDSRADKFESLDNRLQNIHARSEARKQNLNDGSKLDELSVMIDKLKTENKEYDTQIGLLLALYFKLDS